MTSLKTFSNQTYSSFLKYLHVKWVFVILASIPLCLFLYQYLATGNKLIDGDFDYYAQMYEALRVSILKYGQFPSWNPWMAGGLPLYANPQLGLVSIQSALSLVFGAVYGLKLAYVIYALAGFWGMYALGRNVIKADVSRSLLISYVWVFCGFFAGHGIMHFTFALFFLLPWLFLLVHYRHEKWTWLWFGLLESLIILSSIHYAFLMTSVVIAIYFILSLLKVKLKDKQLTFTLGIGKNDIAFLVKSIALIAILTGHRFITAFAYISNNERIIDSPEIYPTAHIIFSSLFLPIATFLEIPQNIQWGWWEYSMYMGLGTGIALLICLIILAKRKLIGPKIKPVGNVKFVLPIVIIGLLGLALAFGDFGRLSPYHLLHVLPGFTQTRVPSRWLVMTGFAILVFLLSWKTNKRLINLLLLLSVFELFLSFGPPSAVGQYQIEAPSDARFSSTFTQYDNGYNHLDMRENINNSYYYSTTKNIGQIYADDSIINTLNKVYGTSKCGINTNKNCSLVLSKNAIVKYWSPNKIIIQREAKGEIVLNMSVQDGWRVNNEYIYSNIKRLDPNVTFKLPDDSIKSYNLEYAPKLSPSWFFWKITHKSN